MSFTEDWLGTALVAATLLTAATAKDLWRSSGSSAHVDEPVVLAVVPHSRRPHLPAGDEAYLIVDASSGAPARSDVGGQIRVWTHRHLAEAFLKARHRRRRLFGHYAGLNFDARLPANADRQDVEEEAYYKALIKERLPGAFRARALVPLHGSNPLRRGVVAEPGWKIGPDAASAGKFEVVHTKDNAQVSHDLTKDEAKGLIVLLETAFPGIGRRKLTNADLAAILKKFDVMTSDDLVEYSRFYEREGSY